MKRIKAVGKTTGILLMPYFRAVGNNGTEAPAYFYKMYGLEKEAEA